jgi:citrate synthase
MTVLKKEHAKVVVGQCTIGQLFGGMRGVKALFSQTAHLDPHEGIFYQGFSLSELRRKLPAFEREPMAEGVFWLLMTGQIPTEEEAESMRVTFLKRAALPEYCYSAVTHLPRTLDANAMLNIGLLTLQRNSQFARAYSEGKLRKTDYWQPMMEDAIDIVAKLPRLASLVYSHKYGKQLGEINPDQDLAGNFCAQLGFERPELTEVVRLFYLLFADHDGGLVSSHSSHLVGSALSDAYLAMSASISASGSPLHATAMVAAVKNLLQCQKDLGEVPNEEALHKYIVKQLEGGKRIPGFGHAVLKATDPRFLMLKVLAETYVPNDSLNRLVASCYRVVPHILMEKRVSNPWPNVHAQSGALLYALGFKDYDFYPCLISVLRTLGQLSSIVQARALMLPIERPDSLDLSTILNHVRD